MKTIVHSIQVMPYNHIFFVQEQNFIIDGVLYRAKVETHPEVIEGNATGAIIAEMKIESYA